MLIETFSKREHRTAQAEHLADSVRWDLATAAIIAFGNSIGDRQMLEYTKAGGGARLALLVLHDDAAREYAYGPAQ